MQAFLVRESCQWQGRHNMTPRVQRGPMFIRTNPMKLVIVELLSSETFSLSQGYVSDPNLSLHVDDCTP